MTTGVTGPGYRSDIQETDKTSGSSPSAATTVTPKGVGAGSVAPAEGTQSYVPPYIEPTPEFPQLPNPNDLSYRPPGSIPGGPKLPEDIYKEKLQQLVDRLSLKDSKLALFVQFAIDHPEQAVPGGTYAKALMLARQYVKEAENYTKTATGNTSFTAPEPDPAEADKLLANRRESIFERLVDDKHSLSQKEKAALILAYNHPELSSSKHLNIRLQSILKSLTRAAERMFNATGIIPKGYHVPKDSSSFDTKTSYDFTEIFEELANQNGSAAKPPFGAKEMNYFLFKLNNPEGPNPPVPEGRTAEEMDALFEKTMTEAKSAFTEKTGFPSKFTPKIDSTFYDAKLLANFENAFEALLATQSPPLTEQQKLLLRTALGQQPENVPKEIKALFEMIKGNALAEVIKSFDLPPSWSPKTRSLSDPKVIKQREQAQMELNAVKSGQEMLNTLSAVVSQMPEGPQKTSMGAYIRAMSDSLHKISVALVTSMVIDSEVSTNLTKATTQTQLDLIKIQQHKADEQWKKQQHAQKMNKVLGIFMSIFMGPIGIALAIQKAETGTNLFEQMVKKVMTSIDRTHMPEIFKAILKAVVGHFVAMAAMMLGGPFMWLMQFQENLTKNISNFLQVFGVDKSKADQIGMISSIALIVAAEIVVMILTGGAGGVTLAGSFGAIMAQISSIVRTVLKTIVDVMKELAKFIMKELPRLVANASRTAQRMAMRVQESLDDLMRLQRSVEKAVNTAKVKPTAANIAKANSAVENFATHFQRTQEMMSKLARQLETEAKIVGKSFDEASELMNAAAKIQRYADKMAGPADDIAKMAIDVAKAAASQSASAIRLEKNIMTGIKVFSYVSIGLTVVSTAVGFGREILLGQIAMIKAEMEADTLRLRAIIKAIKAVIDHIISGLGSTAEHIKTVQTQMNDLFKPTQFVC